jgi:predicted transcriptional regulator
MSDNLNKKHYKSFVYENEKKHFVNQLVKILFHRSMTCKELAALCDLTCSRVSRLMITKNFSPNTAKKILSGLQLTMDALLSYKLPFERR